MTTDSYQFQCPICGQRRTAELCWKCDLKDDGNRSLGDVIVTTMTTVTLLPFLQAIATRAGEQVPALLRRLWQKMFDSPAVDTDVADVIVPDRQLIIRMPQQLSAKGVRRLSKIIASPAQLEGWREVSYVADSHSWQIVPTDPPAPDLSSDD